MRAASRQGLLAVLSAAAGGLFGYLLLNPLLPPPAPQALQFLLPLLRPIDDLATQHGAWYLATALFAFVAYLPNTLLIACLTLLLLRRLGSPRLFFYAALLPTLGIHLQRLLETEQLLSVARRIGLPADLARLPVDPLSAPQGLLLLLNFALFSGSVLLAVRRPTMQGPEASATDKAP
jgi:hypothetical protein